MKTYHLEDLEQTQRFGQKFGSVLEGGEVIELVGDVGAGKTTLVKAIARGLDINDTVQSPTFTISRVYEARDELRLAHYDFYRLNEAGIMREELAEALSDPACITILEWSEIVEGVLPEDRLVINLTSPSEDTRNVTVSANGPVSEKTLEELG